MATPTDTAQLEAVTPQHRGAGVVSTALAIIGGLIALGVAALVGLTIAAVVLQVLAWLLMTLA